MSIETVIGECPKCNGSGYINAFAHIKSGECFVCGGKGKVAGRIEATVSASAGDHGVKAAWLAKFDGYTVEKVYGMFKANLTWDQAWKIHNFADTTTVAWRAARMIMLESLEVAA